MIAASAAFVDVGVREDDLRAVSAELQHAILEAGVARHLLARLDGPGEDDRADVRMRDERWPIVAHGRGRR